MIKRIWNINSQQTPVRFDDDARLLDVLRDNLDQIGTKESCNQGECGACSVLIGSELRLACLTLAASLPDDTQILTVEGLSQVSLGHNLQQAFLQSGIIQCGYCTPGMLLAAMALLMRNPKPTRDQVLRAISGNLCRCSGYNSIVDAILSAVNRVN
jgi:carbon-monoxide dehydrogenase small subunit